MVAGNKHEKLNKTRLRHLWKTQVRPVVMVVTVLCTFRSAIADWNDVPTGSMKPTILEGDRIIVNKLAYDLTVPFTTCNFLQWGTPQHGDIIILYSPADGKRLVKRVIGTPGDRVAMRNNRLWINVHSAEYLPHTDNPVVTERFEQASHAIKWIAQRPRRSSFGPLTIGKDEYLVLGDNRDNSMDSRWFGLVKRHRIVGRATQLAISVDHTRMYRPRRERFGQSLD